MNDVSAFPLSSLIPPNIMRLYEYTPNSAWLFAILTLLFKPDAISDADAVNLAIAHTLYPTPHAKSHPSVPCPSHHPNSRPNQLPHASIPSESPELIDKACPFCEDLRRFLRRFQCFPSIDSCISRQPKCEERDFLQRLETLTAILLNPIIPIDGTPKFDDIHAFSQNFRAHKIDFEALTKLQRALSLHTVKRSGWYELGPDDLSCAERPLPTASLPVFENVASHSFKTALIAYALAQSPYRAPAFIMALFHDWPECLTGDATPRTPISTHDKHEAERRANQTLLSLLPIDPIPATVKNAFPIYMKRRSQNDFCEIQNTLSVGESPLSAVHDAYIAHIVRLADKFDMLIQAVVYQAQTRFNYGEILESAHKEIARDFEGFSHLLQTCSSLFAPQIS